MNRNQRAEASTRSADQPAQPQELEQLLVSGGSGEPDGEQSGLQSTLSESAGPYQPPPLDQPMGEQNPSAHGASADSPVEGPLPDSLALPVPLHPSDMPIAGGTGLGLGPSPALPTADARPISKPPISTPGALPLNSEAHGGTGRAPSPAVSTIDARTTSEQLQPVALPSDPEIDSASRVTEAARPCPTGAASTELGGFAPIPPQATSEPRQPATLLNRQSDVQPSSSVETSTAGPRSAAGSKRSSSWRSPRVNAGSRGKISLMLDDKHIRLDDRDVSSNLMGVGGQTFSPADLASDSGQAAPAEAPPAAGAPPFRRLHAYIRNYLSPFSSPCKINEDYRQCRL
ncbi:hypothetical protein KFL_003520140 [Klebsormidium nitens]|uniref:Uncharacterized protein n=1 Tax=Klebsormidium nitens TaxID=105231 RepID=A0A1Y1I8X3_KLENI|nr:hypothetical protein KFL_003520140 [Klebsormidium nitens]|eukprot:GAQ87435.1 hypothetical protein KFL_003520140 [Klebsormidium nitens]